MNEFSYFLKKTIKKGDDFLYFPKVASLDELRNSLDFAFQMNVKTNILYFFFLRLQLVSSP